MPRVERLSIALFIVLGALVIRLGYLQLIRGAHYHRLAEQNRLRLVPEDAPRGLIVDRRGRVLATSETVFRVAIVPQDIEDLPAVLSQVSAFIHRPVETLERQYRQERSLPFIPTTIASHIPKDVALRLEEARWRLPGLLIRPQVIRHYPLGTTAAHLVGYLSEPTAEELPLLKPYGIRPHQLVGRTGLEQLLDHALQGQSGGMVVEVNHRAKQVRVMGHVTPQAGARVVLTIDTQLQSLLEQAFGSQPGAGVVLEPSTGEVLAMVSVPEFDPEAFATSDTKAVQRLFDDPQTPLMNRATSGAYQPGSIMKLVTAVAALERHLISPTTSVDCHGALTIGDRAFHCWNRDGHGPLVLREALMQSCNVYFMHTAMRIGLEHLRDTMSQVGFSHRTGWPLGEQAGHLPQRRLTEGELALLGIGQGEVLITPLQAAVMVSIFANKGWGVEPWMIRSVADRPMAHSVVRRHLGWSLETIDAVRHGMLAVVRDPGGTGHRAFSEVVTIAGKTGTAQTHLSGHPHGWFVGFCPVDHPRVAMALVVEYGGSGGDLPAEIAKAVCEYVSTSGLLAGEATSPDQRIPHNISLPNHL